MMLMMLMMLFMVLAPVLVVGLIILGVGAGTGLFTQGPRLGGKPVPGAREILAQRYARGEISKDQYDQVLADIAN
jgi:uncharacterized membrane protein